MRKTANRDNFSKENMAKKYMKIMLITYQEGTNQNHDEVLFYSNENDPYQRNQ